MVVPGFARKQAASHPLVPAHLLSLGFDLFLVVYRTGNETCNHFGKSRFNRFFIVALF